GEPRRQEVGEPAEAPGLELRPDETRPPPRRQLAGLAPRREPVPRQHLRPTGPVGVRLARLAELCGSHALHVRAARSSEKASVWRSTSSSIVAGHISAML